MIGPNGTSLLHKLGKKLAYEMTEVELTAIVAADQLRRSVQRTMGRILRQQKDKPIAKPKPTLESLGWAPELIIQLRSSGKTDEVIIKAMREKGLL